jgi:hypothetical protein
MNNLRLINVGKHLVAKKGRVRWTNISHPTFLSKVEDALRGKRFVRHRVAALRRYGRVTP